MKKQFDIKKLVLLNLPYLLMGLFATNFGDAKFLAQPASVGSAGGAVLRCWPASGGVSPAHARQEIPSRQGVWFCPLGNR